MLIQQNLKKINKPKDLFANVSSVKKVEKPKTPIKATDKPVKPKKSTIVKTSDKPKC